MMNLKKVSTPSSWIMRSSYFLNFQTMSNMRIVPSPGNCLKSTRQFLRNIFKQWILSSIVMNTIKRMVNILIFCWIQNALQVIHEAYKIPKILTWPSLILGYKGESARRIWRSIYEENCFLKRSGSSPFSFDDVCYEERVFYRAISGLHSSINIHLCSSYHYMDGTFTYNKQEFIKRFEGESWVEIEFSSSALYRVQFAKFTSWAI